MVLSSYGDQDGSAVTGAQSAVTLIPTPRNGVFGTNLQVPSAVGQNEGSLLRLDLRAAGPKTCVNIAQTLRAPQLDRNEDTQL
jgi:hypothetical protein